MDAGVDIEGIESRTHQVLVSRRSPRRADVTLAAQDRMPKRDFVLRWKVAGNGIKSGLIVHRDERRGPSIGTDGGYFSLMLVPPDDLSRPPRCPVEMVLALDVSRGASGRPLEQAKAAARYALQHLGPDDTFQIVRFSATAESFAPRPAPATPENVRQGIGFLDGALAGGGTSMLEGIRRSLERPLDESRPRCVVFFTDGFLGHEPQILGALGGVLKRSRVFCFGVGPSVNRPLLERMARLGDGAVAYAGSDDHGAEVMASYFERIRHPALTGISVEWGGANVGEVFPQRCPDLFVGRPVVLAGRFAGAPPKRVIVTGRLGGEPVKFEVAAGAAPGGIVAAERALPLVWARLKMADLADRAAYQDIGDLSQQIKRIALDYGLVSSHTAFVTVDSLTRTEGGQGTTVAAPLRRHDATRQETRRSGSKQGKVGG